MTRGKQTKQYVFSALYFGLTVTLNYPGFLKSKTLILNFGYFVFWLQNKSHTDYTFGEAN
jgi:hypothetical protein